MELLVVYYLVELLVRWLDLGMLGLRLEARLISLLRVVECLF